MNFEYKNRAEVPSEYKADLTSIFKSDEIWEDEYQSLKEHINDLSKYQNHILDSSKNLFEVLKLSDDIQRRIEKLYVYASFKKDCDIADTKYIKMYEKIYNLYTEYSVNTSFIIPELLDNDYSLVQKYIHQNPALKVYEFSLEKIYRYKKYTLDAKSEAIISSFANVFESFSNISDILNNTDIKFGSIKVDGISRQITSTNTILFSTHKDRNVRRKANLKKMRRLNEFSSTFATNLIAYLKAMDTICKLRGFDDYQTQALYADNVDKKLYHKLLEFIAKHLDTFTDWYKVVKRILGYKTLYNYDLNAPLIKEYDKTYSIDEAQNIILNALSILGDEYTSALKLAFENHWVDYATYAGKKNIWYQISLYDAYPLVFCNYLGKLEDVSSLAHELGHAMHSYFSNKYNEYPKSEYTIFVAEVASLTSEILVNRYLIDNTSDKLEKLNCIHSLIELIINNFYGASIQAKFEQIVNEKIANNEVLSNVDLNNIWKDIRLEYYQDVVKSDDSNNVNWCRIPHFFSPFYTYKYSIAISVAINVASKILTKDEAYIAKYLNFLKSGDSAYPLEQIQQLAINLEEDEAFEPTINMLKNLMEEFIITYEEVNNE